MTLKCDLCASVGDTITSAKSRTNATRCHLSLLPKHRSLHMIRSESSDDASDFTSAATSSPSFPSASASIPPAVVAFLSSLLNLGRDPDIANSIPFPPYLFCLLFCPPEGEDFDPEAVTHRVAHAALCCAEMFVFIFAIAFLKRFFNLEIVIGRKPVLLEDSGCGASTGDSPLSKADANGDVFRERRDSAESASDARSLSEEDKSPDVVVRTRKESPSVASSKSASLEDGGDDDDDDVSSLSEASEASSAVSSVQEPSASTVPSSKGPSTDNANITFDSNCLASQYDRSDFGDDDPTSFFDNDSVVAGGGTGGASTEYGDDDGAANLPPPPPPVVAAAVPLTSPVQPVFPSAGQKRSRSCDERDENLSLDSGGVRSPPRDGSLDSSLSWFQEHYGHVWVRSDGGDDDASSVAASSTSEDEAR